MCDFDLGNDQGLRELASVHHLGEESFVIRCVEDDTGKLHTIPLGGDQGRKLLKFLEWLYTPEVTTPCPLALAA